METLSTVYNYLKSIDALDLFEIVNHQDYVLVIFKADETNWILIDHVDNKITMNIYDNNINYNNFSLAINNMILLLFGATSEEDELVPAYSPFVFLSWKNNCF